MYEWVIFMKVMTFNLRTDFVLDFNNRWSKRSDIVYNLISKYHCDIVGVQELNMKMYADILENIKDYNIVGNPRTKRFFIERNDILISKEHKIISSNTFWLSKRPEKVGSSKWYSLYPRICTTAAVQLKSGEKVRVYNTHLDCFLPKAREYGLKIIEEYIDYYYKIDNLPIILMGDFNAKPNSKLIKKSQLLNHRNLMAIQESDKTMYTRTTMSMFKGKCKGRHIDYIFVSDEFMIEKAEIVEFNKLGKYPSDHYPIMGEIKLKN